MKYFISLLTAVFLTAGLFSTVATAEQPAMQKLNLLHMEKVQTPYSQNPLAENIIRVHSYIVYDHHGRHYSVCTKWHYTRCHFTHH